MKTSTCGLTTSESITIPHDNCDVVLQKSISFCARLLKNDAHQDDAGVANNRALALDFFMDPNVKNRVTSFNEGNGMGLQTN